MSRLVLVVENGNRQRQIIVAALTAAGFAVKAVTRLAAARAVLDDATQKFDGVVIEESIDGAKGLQLLSETRAKRGRLPVVVVARDGNWRSYVLASGMGAIAYLPRPINPVRLVAALEEATGLPRKKRHNHEPISKRKSQ